MNKHNRNKHPGLYLRGKTWWCKYYVGGKPRRESTGTTKVTEAQTFLDERRGRAATGQPIFKKADKILYDEIAADLRRHYEVTGERRLDEADDRLKPLASFFNGRRVVQIDGALASEYTQRRQAATVSDSTINRELSVLVKMLRMAYENRKLLRLPVIHKPKEGPARKGFFERDAFLSVRKRLPTDLQVAVTIAYTYGWRMQSEVLSLTLSQVDLGARDDEGREVGTLRLEPGTTKNGEGRDVWLTPELKVMLAEQIDRVKALSRKLHRVIPHLFPHLKGRHQGKPIRDFGKRWKTACTKAGVPGMLRHDFRRTAVRNLLACGVAQKVAMEVTGHKTISVFNRYHIVSPRDLQEASRKLAGTKWAQSAPSTENPPLTPAAQPRNLQGESPPRAGVAQG